MVLPINRTTSSTAAEHVSDHNTIHAAVNDLPGQLAAKADASSLLLPAFAYANSFTFSSADANRIAEYFSASVGTATVANDTTWNAPNGTILTGRQVLAGTVTLAGATGVTLRARGNALTTAGTWAEFSLVKRGPNEWVVSGDLVA